jgi:hypothetical protein
LSVGQGKEVGVKRYGKRADCGGIAALSGRRAGPLCEASAWSKKPAPTAERPSRAHRIFQSSRRELESFGAEWRTGLLIEIRDTNAVVKGSSGSNSSAREVRPGASRHANLSASRCSWSP